MPADSGRRRRQQMPPLHHRPASHLLRLLGGLLRLGSAKRQLAGPVRGLPASALLLLERGRPPALLKRSRALQLLHIALHGPGSPLARFEWPQLCSGPKQRSWQCQIGPNCPAHVEHASRCIPMQGGGSGGPARSAGGCSSLPDGSSAQHSLPGSFSVIYPDLLIIEPSAPATPPHAHSRRKHTYMLASRAVRCSATPTPSATSRQQVRAPGASLPPFEHPRLPHVPLPKPLQTCSHACKKLIAGAGRPRVGSTIRRSPTPPPCPRPRVRCRPPLPGAPRALPSSPCPPWLPGWPPPS